MGVVFVNGIHFTGTNNDPYQILSNNLVYYYLEKGLFVCHPHRKVVVRIMTVYCGSRWLNSVHLRTKLRIPVERKICILKSNVIVISN